MSYSVEPTPRVSETSIKPTQSNNSKTNKSSLSSSIESPNEFISPVTSSNATSPEIENKTNPSILTSRPHHIPKLDTLSNRLNQIRQTLGNEVSCYICYYYYLMIYSLFDVSRICKLLGTPKANLYWVFPSQKNNLVS